MGSGVRRPRRPCNGRGAVFAVWEGLAAKFGRSGNGARRCSAAFKACRRAGHAGFGRLGGNVMDDTQL
jgi:hypothetical protein